MAPHTIATFANIRLGRLAAAGGHSTITGIRMGTADQVVHQHGVARGCYGQLVVRHPRSDRTKRTYSGNRPKPSSSFALGVMSAGTDKAFVNLVTTRYCALCTIDITSSHCSAYGSAYLSRRTRRRACLRVSSFGTYTRPRHILESLP